MHSCVAVSTIDYWDNSLAKSIAAWTILHQSCCALQSADEKSADNGRVHLTVTLKRVTHVPRSGDGCNCRGWVGFSVDFAHRMIAACDIILMPSRFEPCGLNQLFAMRYGTIPIAHATGGLRDTIQEFNPFAEGEGAPPPQKSQCF